MIFRSQLRHPFEQRLRDIRRHIKPEPFDWYAFDSFANLPVIESLLPNGLDSVLELAAGEPVADIGTADGDMAFLLESMGCKVTAIDWPGTNNNHLTGFALLRQELGSSVEVREIDIDSQFQLDGDRFGFTFALGLLYHLKNPYYFLETLAVHSRHLVMSTRILPQGSTAEPIARLTGEREFENDPTNFWFFSESGILRLLDRCGWDVSAKRVTGDGDDDRFFCLAESRIGRTKPTIRLLEGWHEMEKHAWRWTAGECGAVIENVAGATNFEFRFVTTASPIEAAGSLGVEVAISGEDLGFETYSTAGPQVYRRKISPAPRRCEVRIRLSHTSSPDGRELGVVVRLPPSTIIDDDCGLRLDSGRIS